MFSTVTDRSKTPQQVAVRPDCMRAGQLCQAYQHVCIRQNIQNLDFKALVLNTEKVYLLTMLSIDRYVTIVRRNTMMRENITKKKRLLTYIVIICIWILAIIATTPYYKNTVYYDFNITGHPGEGSF